MESHTYNKKNWLKLIVGLGVCLVFRLIPFRPPNIEPILATAMPFGKAYGTVTGFLFAFISIILYDTITGTVGVWTIITATTYGILGIGAAMYFKNRKNNSWNYVKFAIIGTLVFDAITGLSVGPLFFQQPFMVALVGQIPFTAMHLIGNIGFAAILSPALYRFVIQNETLEIKSVFSLLKSKHA